jgi:hypothetical protein
MNTCIVVIVSLLATMLFYPSEAHTERRAVPDSIDIAVIIKAKALVMRLDIINTTDQSEFTKAEKRTLRKEARHIKSNLKELRGGRYVRTTFLVLLFLVPVSVFQLTE